MYKNEIKENIKSILLQKQYERNNVVKNNLDKMLQIEEFKSAYFKVKDLEFEIPKLEYNNQNADKLKKELKQQQEILEVLLKKNGFSNDDIKTDNSNITIQNVVHHKDYKFLLNQELLKASGFNVEGLHSFEESNFELFGKDIRDSVRSLYKTMEKYTNQLYSTNKKNITITGKTGVGKTFLAQCMASNAIANGIHSYFVPSTNLITDLLRYHTDSTVVDRYNILKKYTEPQFLIIDDLGVEPFYNNISQEYIYLIIEQRLMQNKNTLITTNLNIGQVRDVYGERIFSRISNQANSILINLEGKDLRLNI